MNNCHVCKRNRIEYGNLCGLCTRKIVREPFLPKPLQKKYRIKETKKK